MLEWAAPGEENYSTSARVRSADCLGIARSAVQLDHSTSVQEEN